MKSTSPLFNQGKGKLGNYVASYRGDQSIISARVFDKPASSDAQKSQQAVFGGTSSQYKHLLTPEQRQKWIDLGSKMRSKTGKPLSGANAFSSVNGTLAILGADPLMDAPFDVPYIANLPGVEVDGQSTPSGAGFLLKLLSAAYTGRILVEATPFLSAGLSKIPASFFRILGTREGLLAASTDITALYVAKFGSVPSSSQIAVRLTVITDDGFRGTTLTTAGFVALATAEAALPETEDEAEGEPTGELHVSAPLSEDAQNAA